MYLFSVLDFANKVNAGFESLSILLPLCWANFAVVASYVESSLYLANELFSVAADAIVLDFCNLNETLGVYEECTTIGSAIFFVEDTKTARDNAEVVSEHGVGDLLDAVGSVVPSLVREVRVSAYRVNFHTHFLELTILFGKVNEFGGANEGEVCRIEEEDAPLACDVCAAHFLEVAVVESLYLEFRCLCVDDGLHIVIVLFVMNLSSSCRHSQPEFALEMDGAASRK